MTSRSTRAVVAKETVAICKAGRYENSLGEQVHFKHDIERAVKGSKHYPCATTDQVLTQRDELLQRHDTPTQFVLKNCTTLEAASELARQPESGHIACLNFASAKNPGGGFLNGSQAQEESLARASALYECIHPLQAHYDEGRSSSSCLYTDSMIFSPMVPVFRNDDDELLDESYNVSFITSPAVNRGALGRERKVRPQRIESVMTQRFEKVLSLAIIHRVDSLVLGAWGCGVFKNDPEMIADVFYYHLIENQHLTNVFQCIYHAVLDRRDRGIFTAFEKRFASHVVNG